LRECVLVGHSDGASIALLAAATLDSRIRGVISEAAHLFVERESIDSIERAVVDYETGGLRERLARYHGETVDSAFYGWARTWLSPAFEAFHIEGYMRAVTCPVLAIQGADDPYGTRAQLDMIASAVSGPIECLWLENCGHAPHVDARDAVFAAMTRFVAAALGRRPANDTEPAP